MGINLSAMGYDTVTAANPGEFVQLQPGGYVCRIIKSDLVKSKAGKDMLVLFIDIDEGEHANFFHNAFERRRKFDADARWDNSGTYRQLLADNSGKVSPFFKGLLTTIVNSNTGFNFNVANFECTSLRGLLCGFIFAQEEYTKRDGSVGVKTVPKSPRTVTEIREGNFTVPQLQKAQSAAQPAHIDAAPVDNDDVPF